MEDKSVDYEWVLGTPVKRVPEIVPRSCNGCCFVSDAGCKVKPFEDGDLEFTIGTQCAANKTVFVDIKPTSTVNTASSDLYKAMTVDDFWELYLDYKHESGHLFDMDGAERERFFKFVEKMMNPEYKEYIRLKAKFEK